MGARRGRSALGTPVGGGYHQRHVGMRAVGTVMLRGDVSDVVVHPMGLTPMGGRVNPDDVEVTPENRSS